MRYPTFEELRVYCYRVASAVGLVSIEIFGYRNPACKEYAIQLGLALQTTNIIRDVDKDLDGPGEFTCRRKTWPALNIRKTNCKLASTTTRFVELMDFQAARAPNNFLRGPPQLLPAEDRTIDGRGRNHGFGLSRDCCGEWCATDFGSSKKTIV